MNNNPLLLSDGYKTSHIRQYPQGTSLVYSNFTPRSVSYMPELAKSIVVFGIQYTMKYIHDIYQENFFSQPKDIVVGEAKQFLDSYLNTDYDVSHFEALHDLGYLPINVKALEEGSIIDAKIPILTIYNTLPEFFWLPNFLETLISSLLWKPLHSASLAHGFKKLLVQGALDTDKDNIGFVDFQGHDFSFRGMQHPESAISSGLGWVTSFKGSDTIPVLQAAKYYYGGENVAFSCPASEHSVVTAYGKEDELGAFRRLMSQYPNGILSIVSDSFDLWKVCTEYMVTLKDEIMARDGKVVLRPDSGNPVDIICGFSTEYKDLSKWFPEGEVLPKYFEYYLLDEVRENTPHGEHGVTEYENIYLIRGKLYKAKIHNISWNRYDKQYYYIDMWEEAEITVEELEIKPSDKGVVELLWDVFGGTINEQGYKVLDSHIGCIYGDSISLERTIQIIDRLKAKGFASTNVVLGVGSYSLGYATRDSQGSAVKATYIEITNGSEPTTDGDMVNSKICRNIFKDPITDDGTKKSACGLLYVQKNPVGEFELIDKVDWVTENKGELKPLYLNGEFLRETTIDGIKNKLNEKL